MSVKVMDLTHMGMVPRRSGFLGKQVPNSIRHLYSPPCVPDHPPLIDALLIWLASLCFNDGVLSFGQRQAIAKPMPLRAIHLHPKLSVWPILTDRLTLSA